MKKQSFKKLIGLLFLFIFVFQTSYVFALELKYPKVPGSQTPQEIQEKIKSGEISGGEALPLYIKYVFNLSLIIITIICLSVIIYGGVLWLLSPASPSLKKTAQQWMTSGILGFLIIFLSYFVLSKISPQFVSFPEPEKEKISLPTQKKATFPFATSTYFMVPTGKLIEEILENIEENLQKNGGIMKALKKDISIKSENLQKALKSLEGAASKCNCGEGNCHAGFHFNLAEMTCYCEPYQDQPCKIECSEETLTQIGSKVVEVKRAMADIEGARIKLAGLQMPIIIDYLQIKKAAMLMGLTEDLIDYGEFDVLKQYLESEKLSLPVKTFENWPQDPLITKVNPETGEEEPVVDPATFYFPYDNWTNQQLIKETQRLNPIIIFANTSPQEVNDEIAEIINEAFGGNILEYIDEDELIKIIQDGLEDGTMDTFEELLSVLADKLDDVTVEEINKNLTEKIGGEGSSMLFEKLIFAAQVKAQENDDPLSEKIKEFLKSKLEERLPEKLRGDLSTSTLNLIDRFLREHGEEGVTTSIKQIFKADVYDLLDDNIKFLLSTSLTDLAPSIETLFNSRMNDLIYLVFSIDLLAQLDDFLNEKLKGFTGDILTWGGKLVEDLFNEITNYIKNNWRLSEFMGELIYALTEFLRVFTTELVKGYIQSYINYYIESFLKDTFKLGDRLEELLKLTLKDVFPDLAKYIEWDLKNLLPDKARDFLRKDFIDYLPKGVKDILEGSLKNLIPAIKDILDTSILSLLGIDEELLNTTLYDLFPQKWKECFEKTSLPKELDTKIISLIPEKNKRPLTEIKKDEDLVNFFQTPFRELLLPPEVEAYLQKTLLEVLGMQNKKVVDILDPKVKILMELTEEYLKPEERPEAVNEMIDFLKKPLIAAISEQDPKVADTLEKTLYTLLPEDYTNDLNKSFWEQFPAEAKKYIENPPSLSLPEAVKAIDKNFYNKLFEKSILDHLEENENVKIPTRLKDYLPPIVNEKIIDILPESWQKTISDYIDITDEEINKAIEETVVNIEAEIEKELGPLLDKLGEEISRSIVKPITDRISEQTGKDFSEENLNPVLKKVNDFFANLIEKALKDFLSKGVMRDSLDF